MGRPFGPVEVQGVSWLEVGVGAAGAVARRELGGELGAGAGDGDEGAPPALAESGGNPLLRDVPAADETPADDPFGHEAPLSRERAGPARL